MKTQISIKNFINLKKELSKRKNLQTIYTTDQANGYPSNTNFGIVGFSNFEAAENFAKKYGLTICQYHARDGWHLWHRQNFSVWKPLAGAKGGKVMSISEDTHHYIIGVEFIN